MLFSRTQLLYLKSSLSSFTRLFKKRSFLSNSESAKAFVDLLGHRESKLLLEELQSRLEISTNISNNSPPTLKQLQQITFSHSLPFIGFGFLDNFIMISAGEYIDMTIGITLGISTMAAAGLGNAVSDVAGIGSAWYVERLSAKIGIEYPKLSFQQLEMSRTRWSIQMGKVIGIIIGCLFGMFPLLFTKRKNQVISTFQSSS